MFIAYYLNLNNFIKVQLKGKLKHKTKNERRTSKLCLYRGIDKDARDLFLNNSKYFC